jgi:hypothetical protein
MAPRRLGPVAPLELLVRICVFMEAHAPAEVAHVGRVWAASQAVITRSIRTLRVTAQMGDTTDACS